MPVESISFQIKVERTENGWLVENEDLEIFAGGATLEDGLCEFADQFAYLAKFYGMLDCEQITQDAQKNKEFFDKLEDCVIDWNEEFTEPEDGVYDYE